MRNVLVVGAGLSGLMGALALAEAGYRPLILAKGQGTTHWTGGTIDIWGNTNGVELGVHLVQVIEKQTDHPYAYMGLDGIEDALSRFRALMERARYPYVGNLERNIYLPSAAGALRPTAYMPITMVGGDMRLGGSLLLAGFRELRDFFPAMIAANLQSQGITARSTYLEVPERFRRIDYTTRIFANLFDQPDFRREIGQQLRAIRGDAKRIGLPAVLGLKDAPGVVQDLQSLSGAQIFEISTLPPSVPGMRLYSIFQQAIEAAGGRLQIGSEVVGSASENGKLTSISTAAAARKQQHQVRGVLLTTGGVAGGGIRTDFEGKIWETALDLPLLTPETRAGWFATRFIDQGGHPIFRTGVVTNKQFQPLDRASKVIYSNVVAAGSILACSDPVHDRALTGLALTTGWQAGQQLATLLGN